MNRDRDPGHRDNEPEDEEYDEDAPRSIFAALWFRALLAVLVLGVLAAVAVPYVLDFATHSTSDSTPAKGPASAPTSAVTPPPAQPAASSPPTAAPARPAAVPAPPSAASSAPPAVATPAPAEPPKVAASAPATAEPARPTPTVAPVKDPPKRVETPKESPRVVAAAKPTVGAKAASAGTGSGPFWVQVGAFKDPEAAKRLLGQLRQQGFQAEQSVSSKGGVALAPADSPGDRYSVVVSGGSAGDVDAKLAAKGMTSEAGPGGAIVRPSLPLRDAVALSRELADAGLTVQVRRQGAAATSAPTRTGETWYRVRVGGFPDRGAAVASLKKLEEKGFKPFIATGNE